MGHPLPLLTLRGPSPYPSGLSVGHPLPRWTLCGLSPCQEDPMWAIPLSRRTPRGPSPCPGGPSVGRPLPRRTLCGLSTAPADPAWPVPLPRRTLHGPSPAPADPAWFLAFSIGLVQPWLQETFGEETHSWMVPIYLCFLNGMKGNQKFLKPQ